MSKGTKPVNSVDDAASSAAPKSAPAAASRRRNFEINPIKKVSKASELVASQIRRSVINGNLNDGDLLPPETHLTVSFGVSRPTIREAFRILEAEGFVTVSRGSRAGARVNVPTIPTAARFAGYALKAIGTRIADIYEAQLAFEPYAARLLAEKRDRLAILELKAALAELEGLSDPNEIYERQQALAQYHSLIVRLSGNKTLHMFCDTLMLIVRNHQAQEPPPPPAAAQDMTELEFRALASKSIRKLLRLIEAGDADGAEAHWRAHIKNASAYWLSDNNPEIEIAD